MPRGRPRKNPIITVPVKKENGVSIKRFKRTYEEIRAGLSVEQKKQGITLQDLKNGTNSPAENSLLFSETDIDAKFSKGDIVRYKRKYINQMVELHGVNRENISNCVYNVTDVYGTLLSIKMNDVYTPDNSKGMASRCHTSMSEKMEIFKP